MTRALNEHYTTEPIQQSNPVLEFHVAANAGQPASSQAESPDG